MWAKTKLLAFQAQTTSGYLPDPEDSNRTPLLESRAAGTGLSWNLSPQLMLW